MSATISGDSFGSFSRAGAIGTLNPAARGGRDFAELLGIAERGALRSELTPEQRARDTAERFIASGRF